MTFTDKTGQSWSLAFTLGDVSRCRKVAGVDIGRGLVNFDKLAEAVDDPDKFLACLLVITDQQRKDAKVETQEAFENRFDGPTLQAARVSFLESVANFYHPPKTANAMTAAIRKAMENGDELTAATIQNAMTSTSNDSATNSADSAA